MDAAILVGRLLLVGLFIYSGMGKLMDLPGTAGNIASKGLPAPMVLAVAAGVIEVVGGLMVAVGWYTRVGAIALIVFTVVATAYFHNFWDLAPGPARFSNMISAFKNVALIGAFLIVAGFGAGRYAIDARRDLTHRI